MVVSPAAASPPLPALDALPRHVAIIMDGNGRWATARGLTRSEGHRAGAEAIRPVIERLAAHGVPVLTLFGFSTENWGRPRAEVETILRLGGEFIDRYLDELHEQDIRLQHLGSSDRLPRSLRQKVRQAVERTAANDRMTVNLAFNYGGRADIVEAVRRLVHDGVPAEDVTEEAIGLRLATAGQPEPDLLVRTGGEHRISNFLVWQATYSEYYFTDRAWPDFGADAVDDALVEFARRRRRFGRLPGEATDDGSVD
ncbi:MAG: polyprenyl diphosphate synthase [Dehalococcoidia bacterium]